MHARIKTHCGIHNPDEYNIACRDVAQLGSALPWGGRGHAFESRRSDHVTMKPRLIGAFSFITKQRPFLGKSQSRIANCHFGAILTCSLAFCPLGLHQRGHFVL